MSLEISNFSYDELKNEKFDKLLKLSKNIFIKGKNIIYFYL